MLSNIIMGLTTAFLPMNLLAALGGTVLGICFGAMPGLSATMGIAVLIPVSYGMSPATGLILLAGVYVGATYGGSISAILVNTPGTPSAAATGWDGHDRGIKDQMRWCEPAGKGAVWRKPAEGRVREGTPYGAVDLAL